MRPRDMACALLAIGVTTTALACSREDGAQADTTSADSTAVMRTVDTVKHESATVRQSCVVADSAIGPIRLGMTLAEAKQSLPAATFERGLDGDGVASVGVTVDGDTLVSIVADGDDAETIAWDKRITWLETFSPRCSTKEGVHPGSLVLDVEKILGKVTKIVRSEIESREFIDFERQPPGLTFRLDYTGVFPEGSRETRSFDPKGRIFSIAVTPN